MFLAYKATQVIPSHYTRSHMPDGYSKGLPLRPHIAALSLSQLLLLTPPLGNHVVSMSVLSLGYCFPLVTRLQFANGAERLPINHVRRVAPEYAQKQEVTKPRSFRTYGKKKTKKKKPSRHSSTHPSLPSNSRCQFPNTNFDLSIHPLTPRDVLTSTYHVDIIAPIKTLSGYIIETIPLWTGE